MNPNVTADYAATIARLAGIDVAHLRGLDALALDVLYYGTLAADASGSFRDRIDRISTPALEMFRHRPSLTPAERAACNLTLARRANAAREATR